MRSTFNLRPSRVRRISVCPREMERVRRDRVPEPAREAADAREIRGAAAPAGGKAGALVVAAAGVRPGAVAAGARLAEAGARAAAAEAERRSAGAVCPGH